MEKLLDFHSHHFQLEVNSCVMGGTVNLRAEIKCQLHQHKLLEDLYTG